MNLITLTQSSLATYRRCPRQYFYRYELGLSRERSEQPLRLGSAFHLGQELRRGGEAEAIEAAVASYEITPQWADSFDWAVERETVRAMLAGYFWRYPADEHEIIAVESTWRLPLKNPETGASSRGYELAGKIDKIVRLADGRLAVLEYKTTSEDISEQSDYWSRLRCDAQISAYVYAARQSGHAVETVLYDVTRKPEISPKKIPVLDEAGLKIVEDSSGVRQFLANGRPRQTPAGIDGLELRTSRETPESFGVRLLADIGERPDFYFARREIARLESDLAEFAEEAWQHGQQLHQSRRRSLWFRNVGPMTCRHCEYKEICLQGITVEPNRPPAGFVASENKHPELTEGGLS